MPNQTLKPRETETEPEVFAATPEAIPHTNCDAKGCNSVSARHTVSKGDFQLFFCAHHMREKAEKFLSDDWKITPENYGFEFKKTQAAS